jgi:hypothetical protein
VLHPRGRTAAGREAGSRDSRSAALTMSLSVQAQQPAEVGTAQTASAPMAGQMAGLRLLQQRQLGAAATAAVRVQVLLLPMVLATKGIGAGMTRAAGVLLAAGAESGSSNSAMPHHHPQQQQQVIAAGSAGAAALAGGVAVMMTVTARMTGICSGRRLGCATLSGALLRLLLSALVGTCAPR